MSVSFPRFLTRHHNKLPEESLRLPPRSQPSVVLTRAQTGDFPSASTSLYYPPRAKITSEPRRLLSPPCGPRDSVTPYSVESRRLLLSPRATRVQTEGTLRSALPTAKSIASFLRRAAPGDEKWATDPCHIEAGGMDQCPQGLNSGGHSAPPVADAFRRGTFHRRRRGVDEEKVNMTSPYSASGVMFVGCECLISYARGTPQRRLTEAECGRSPNPIDPPPCVP
ncbi:hypothetical protein SKAU_G00040230 [Synaphobranchus kaupii]|uniref:Uncharacterized protein n=1 Tax=Synaphobranchus kaupii TaxID=118154 RepID=A0A9Q1J8E1_SYNKA|nr:hypothetical protein SKAU_G00040230 [Synaphobranchus kaupii]